MVQVIPGILEQEFAEIKRKIRLVEPYASWVQIDVLDGTLFNNTCFHDPKPFADLDTPLLLEAHLMVEDPVRFIEPFYSAGFDRFIAHLEGFGRNKENRENVYDFIHQCRNFGAQIALAIDLPTAVEKVLPYLESLDQVLVMSINTGKSGQQFRGEVLEKIKAIARSNPDIPIEVDGGINPNTAPLAVAAGASRLVATSSIFKSDNIKQAIDELKKAGR